MSEKKEIVISECKDFFKVVQDFIPDLLHTFPEYKETLDPTIIFILSLDLDMLGEREFTDEELNRVRELLDYCNQVYPPRFFDIIYQNEEIFTQEDVDCRFIPNIDFKDLWKQKISENTRSILWKYLQLITFSIVFIMKDQKDFGDTAKMFEAIDEDTLKTKLEETLESMKDIFQTTEGDDISMNQSDISLNLPKVDEIHEHINTIMNGKIGLLAKEIGDEAMKDLDLDMNNQSSIEGVMKTMFKNPNKLMKIFNTVSTKLQDKINSGEIDEKELMKEATDMMGKMKSMPMMNNIEEIMKQMGGMKGAGGKVDMSAMMSQMNQYMNKNKQVERMRRKLEAKKVIEHFEPNMNNNLVFSKGEKPERSMKGEKPKNMKKKRKNKKNKK